MALGRITVEARLRDEEIRATLKRAEEKGKAIFVLKSELKDPKGNIVAAVENTYMIIAKAATASKPAKL
jgi:hypothetical protein